VCPPIERYDAATLDAAVAEVKAGTAPVLARLGADYGTLRAKLRAAGCR